ncbi:hypothetical protein BDF14DRAFT_1850924, partial [Spinellus fusiger]
FYFIYIYISSFATIFFFFYLSFYIEGSFCYYSICIIYPSVLFLFTFLYTRTS